MRDEIKNYLSGIPMPNKKEASNLRYCMECKTVWERAWHMGVGLKCTKHHDMPSYKLDREFCFDCDKGE